MISRILTPLVDYINKLFGKVDYNERTDYGETDDCYWVWDINDNRLAYMYGEYYYNDQKVNVTKNKDGEVISFTYVTE